MSRGHSRFLGLVVAAALVGCGGEAAAPIGGAVIELVGDDDAPVVGATIDIGSVQVFTDERGRASLGADAPYPVMAVIAADGFLTEVIAIEEPERDEAVRVAMRASLGGRRWVMHAAGDVMFGRRYEAPTEGEPLLPSGDVAAGARAVVAPVARAFAAADVRVVNLETAVTEAPDAASYPGKRFVLRTAPAALAGLGALGVDVASLANNHIRDFLDRGGRDTLDALEQAGIIAVGAGFGTEDDEAAAAAPAILTLDVTGDGGDGGDGAGGGVSGEIRVGILAWSTLSGAAANDSLPDDDAVVPADLTDDRAWQYEARVWEFESPSLTVAAEARRVGSAWRLFADNESRLSLAEVDAAWASLRSVYPELQDWVARRGHGGAAYWQREASTAAIAALAEQVDVVVVQLHAGYNFQPTPSSYARETARAAIDAGADLVVAHHPHVLQGAEWYGDGLIAYSMGNFVFDQDFLLSFSSAFLRTVWDGDSLLEARYVPIELDAYRPVPVVGGAARRAARALWEKSQLGATCDDIDGDVRAIVDDPAEIAALRPAHIQLRHHSAVLGEVAPTAISAALTLPSEVAVPIDARGLVYPPELSALSLGRSLFEWGHFEDLLADGERRAGTHWQLDDEDTEVVIGPYAYRGRGYLRVRRAAGGELPAFVRPLARVPMPAHRLYRWQDAALVGADGPARYSVRLVARLAGGGTPFLTLSLYQFDDGSPSEDPTSRALAEHELAIEIEPDGQWRELELAIPDAVIQQGDERANAALMYVRLGPPSRGEAYFDVDELTLIEWRAADALPARPGAYDFAKNHAAEERVVTLEVLPLE
ncbi:MAG: hypothetical protein Tsb0020_26870 [Haliangiales bacterium]